MPQLSLLFLAIWCACFANALDWQGPKATNTPTRLITSAIVPETTPLASLVTRDAVGLETCGYVGADQTRPATCSPSSSCVWHTDLRVVGCCDMTKTKSACLFYTSCRDAGSDTTFVDDPLVYTCTGSQGCFQNVYDNGFFQVGCGFTQAIVRTTYNGQPPEAPTVSVVFTGARELDATPTETVASTTGGFQYTTITSIATSTADAQSSQHGIGGNGAAGIAIGCLAAGVIAVAFFTLCFIRRKKNKDAAAMGNPPGPQSSGYVQQERFPSMTMYASPNTQHSVPASPNMYSATLPPSGDSIHQGYPHALSPGMQPSEMEAPPREMDASPTPKVVPKEEVKNTETGIAL